MSNFALRQGMRCVVTGDTARQAHQFASGTEVIITHWQWASRANPVWSCVRAVDTYAEAEDPGAWWVAEDDLQPIPHPTPEEMQQAEESIRRSIEAQGG